MSVELEERTVVDISGLVDAVAACQSRWEPDCPREVRWLIHWPCCGTEHRICDYHRRLWLSREAERMETERRLILVFPQLEDTPVLCPYCGRDGDEPTWRKI